MPRKKIVEEIVEEEVVEEVDEELKESFEVESEEKQAYRELIEKYAKQNPVKYAQKKEVLLEKLNSM
jgi:hypothetical protein